MPKERSVNGYFREAILRMNRSIGIYNFTVRRSIDDPKIWIATCPELPNLSTFGPTPGEALADAASITDEFIEIVNKPPDKPTAGGEG